MGVSLENKSSSFYFNHLSWATVLSLAEAYGWQPTGTLPGFFYTDSRWGLDPSSWDGNYHGNCTQVVCSEDTNALADALEKSLDDIPGHHNTQIRPANTKSSIDVYEVLNQYFRDSDIEKVRPHVELILKEYFAGCRKKYLIEFIAFCREGEFIII